MLPFRWPSLDVRGILSAEFRGRLKFCMFDPNTPVPKSDPILNAHRPNGSQEPKQRQMMVIALALLLVALGFVLYHDRDFWFPDQPLPLESEDEPQRTAPAVSNPQVETAAASKTTPSAVSRPRRSAQSKTSTPAAPLTTPQTPPAGATTIRTVLPPLEVEVVAGDVHRTVHPGSNSVRVDLQSGSKPGSTPDAAQGNTAENGANLTNAAEHVQMSADTNEVVTRTVRPGYPLLARQMKVQGSVILQALIGRDGDIQGLHVVSGPPILAGAAQEAVKQWRFKPHYQGAEAVETQAKITVNFTISTN
jgi:protein TonB